MHFDGSVERKKVVTRNCAIFTEFSTEAVEGETGADNAKRELQCRAKLRIKFEEIQRCAVGEKRNT